MKNKKNENNFHWSHAIPILIYYFIFFCFETISRLLNSFNIYSLCSNFFVISSQGLYFLHTKYTYTHTNTQPKGSTLFFVNINFNIEIYAFAVSLFVDIFPGNFVSYYFILLILLSTIIFNIFDSKASPLTTPQRN